MDLENLISMIKDSDFTIKIVQMVATTAWKLFDKFLMKKLENQSIKKSQPKSLKGKGKSQKKK